MTMIYRRPIGMFESLAGGSMPATDGPAIAHSDILSSGVTRRSRQRKVLENRDLCRIVVAYIPN